VFSSCLEIEMHGVRFRLVGRTKVKMDSAWFRSSAFGWARRTSSDDEDDRRHGRQHRRDEPARRDTSPVRASANLVEQLAPFSIVRLARR
jgi:hypothetical protein